MIEPEHPHMSVRRQSVLLGADRGRVYRAPRSLCEADLALMRWMDEVSLEDPTAGARAHAYTPLTRHAPEAWVFVPASPSLLGRGSRRDTPTRRR
jgi:hypothetical protein